MTAGERCHVSVLFADVCGYTALNEFCDPEELAPILEQIRRDVERVVTRHGGAVNEWRGDGALCIFGLPQANERDARRAIQAALELHQAIRSLTVNVAGVAAGQLRFHSGIDSGLVYVREGDRERGRYELIGDAVNTAARLCAAAAEDEILASEITLQGLEEFFAAESLAPLMLKGKRQPVHARRIRGRTRIETRSRASSSRGLTPLVGRHSDLESLVDVLANVEQRGLSVVGVIGVPGIGKTRLLEELQARVSSRARVLSGYCEESESAIPMQPFVQMLSQLHQREPSTGPPSLLEATVAENATAFDSVLDLPRRVDLISGLLGSPGSPGRADPDTLQHAIATAFEGLFAILSQHAPMVLLLDDWQWSDDSSRRILSGIVRSLSERQILIVVAMRGPLLDPLQTFDRVVELAPFTAEESASVVGALLPHAFDVGIVAALHQRSGGNPLFLEVLCRTLLGESPATEEDLAGNVSATLNSLIRSKLARLPARNLTILQAAAVIGGDFSLPLLERLTLEIGLVVDAAELEHNEVVYASDKQGGFRFRHGVIRDVVYESVRLNERRRLHAAAARALEEQLEGAATGHEPLEALAYHHGGAQNHDTAAIYSERAGDRARATSSLDRARQHYRSALEALDKLEGTRERRQRWVSIAGKLATAWLYRPAHEVFHWLERMGTYAEALGNAPAVARADYWLGWFHYAYGEQELALRHHHRALDRARALHDAPLENQLLLNVGQSLAAASDYAEASIYFERALAIRRALGGRAPERAGNVFGLAYALSTRAMMLGELGDFHSAYRDAVEAQKLVEGSGHPAEPACLGALCLIQLLHGDFGGCLETSSRTRAAAARVGGHFIFALNQVIAGRARWMLEHSRDAIQEMLHGCQWLEKRRLLLFGSFAYAQVAEVLELTGEVETAKRYAGLALERTLHRDHSGEALAYRTLVRICRIDRDAGDARQFLQKALECAQTRASLRELALTWMCSAEHDLQTGNAASAARALGDARAAFQKMNMPFYENEARRLASNGATTVRQVES